MPLGTEVGLGPGHIVLDGDPARPRKGTQQPPTESGTAAPHFSAHIYCGQTAGWIRMPLGTEVGLGPGYIVLYGDTAVPHGKEHSSLSTFAVYGRRQACVRKPRSMSIVVKRLDGSTCHLVRRYASAQATLCYTGTLFPTERGTASLLSAPCLL